MEKKKGSRRGNVYGGRDSSANVQWFLWLGMQGEKRQTDRSQGEEKRKFTACSVFVVKNQQTRSTKLIKKQWLVSEEKHTNPK